MQADFWHQRWQAGEIGFHKHDYNVHMTQFIDLLGIEQGDHMGGRRIKMEGHKGELGLHTFL